MGIDQLLRLLLCLFVLQGFRHALLIGKAGGVDAVLGALKVHQSSPETLAAVCGALTSLAANVSWLQTAVSSFT